MKRTVVLAAVGVLCLATTAYAGVQDDIAAAVTRGDYETGFKLTRPLAEQGDAGAQSMLGGFYFYGRGVARDPAEAEKWFKKAADQGQKDAGPFLAAAKAAQQDEMACLSYGATRGTPGFENCFKDLFNYRATVLDLQQKQEAAQTAAAQAAQKALSQQEQRRGGMFDTLMQPSPGASSGGLSNPKPSSSGGGAALTGAPRFYVGEQISGFNKICLYDRLGSREAVTVGSTEFCPRM